MLGSLGIILVFGSVITFLFIIRLIRKSSIRIEDTFFWIIFSFILILISLFPKIIYIISDKLGFQSPVNLVYLIIIFILIVHQFFMSLKISRLTIKQKELVQAMAIHANQNTIDKTKETNTKSDKENK